LPSGACYAVSDVTTDLVTIQIGCCRFLTINAAHPALICATSFTQDF
jgi:hypothetical protein